VFAVSSSCNRTVGVEQTSELGIQQPRVQTRSKMNSLPDIPSEKKGEINSYNSISSPAGLVQSLSNSTLNDTMKIAAVPLDFGKNQSTLVPPASRSPNVSTLSSDSEPSLKKKSSNEGKRVSTTLTSKKRKKSLNKAKRVSTAPTPPSADPTYFDKEYKFDLVDYWKHPFEDPTVLEYLTNGKGVLEGSRGQAYAKFLRPLFELQKDYLSPEDLMKKEHIHFKWELHHPLEVSKYNGMKSLIQSMVVSNQHKGGDDWILPDGGSLLLRLKEDPKVSTNPKWRPWLSVEKSSIDGAGNGLFAAREFQPGQIIGFYVGNTIFTYPKKFTKQGSMEYLQSQNAILEDDTRTVTMLNKDGKRVLVNPLYFKDKDAFSKTPDPPLFMGIHFLNDFHKVFCEKTDSKVKKQVDKMNNVWIDDQGGVRANIRILLGTEMFMSYEGKRAYFERKEAKKRALMERTEEGTDTQNSGKKKKATPQKRKATTAATKPNATEKKVSK
jgi:hypothetical protein